MALSQAPDAPMWDTLLKFKAPGWGLGGAFWKLNQQMTSLARLRALSLSLTRSFLKTAL